MVNLAKKERDLKRILKRVHQYAIGARCGLSIKTGHALTGVRTNGWQQLQNLANVLKHLDAHVRRLRREREEAAEAVRVAAKLQRETLADFWENFRLCPDCEGYPSGVWHREDLPGWWEDCATCKGHGIVKLDGKPMAASFDFWNTTVGRDYEARRDCKRGRLAAAD